MKYRALVILGWLVAAGAQATTIDFAEFGSEQGLGAIQSKGYTLTAVGTGNMPPDYAFFGSPTDTFYAYCPDCFMTLENTAGDPFSLFSVDLQMVPPSEEVTISITGILAGGGTISTSYTQDPNVTGFTTVTFGSAWQNLSLDSVVFGTGFSPFGHALDNIVVSTVPVPAAVWMFGSALLGLAGWRRKRVS